MESQITNRFKICAIGRLKEFCEGKTDFPLDRKLEHDAQHDTLFKQVSTLVMSEKCLFAAYNKTCELFESNRSVEITLIQEQYHKLMFKV